MNKWKLSDFLQELETRLWEECGTVYKLGGIGRYDGANGKRTYDCVGIFKSILWDYPFHPENYGKTYPDVNVGGMKNRCTKVMKFDANKLEPGMLVFINNEHIGMVGDPKYFINDTDPVNLIYESTPAFLNCLQRTSLADRASRQWTQMGYADFIDYTATEEEPTQPSEDTSALEKDVAEMKNQIVTLQKDITLINDKLAKIKEVL